MADALDRQWPRERKQATAVNLIGSLSGDGARMRPWRAGTGFWPSINGMAPVGPGSSGKLSPQITPPGPFGESGGEEVRTIIGLPTPAVNTDTAIRPNSAFGPQYKVAVLPLAREPTASSRRTSRSHHVFLAR